MGLMDWTLTDSADSGQRLDKHLAKKLPEMSRTRLQDLIKDGHITLNGKATKAGAILKTGATISTGAGGGAGGDCGAGHPADDSL